MLKFQILIFLIQKCKFLVFRLGAPLIFFLIYVNCAVILLIIKFIDLNLYLNYFFFIFPKKLKKKKIYVVTSRAMPAVHEALIVHFCIKNLTKVNKNASLIFSMAYILFYSLYLKEIVPLNKAKLPVFYDTFVEAKTYKQNDFLILKAISIKMAKSDRPMTSLLKASILGYFDFQLKRYIDTNSFPKISKQMTNVNKKTPVYKKKTSIFFYFKRVLWWSQVFTREISLFYQESNSRC